MALKIFTGHLLQDNENIELYAAEFKKLKQHPNFQSKILGVDRDFSRPPSAKLAELMHYHIIDLEPNKKRKTSDRFLVYTRGFTNPDYYLLIAVIEPEAHKKTRSAVLMSLLTEIAEKFRNKY